MKMTGMKRLGVLTAILAAGILLGGCKTMMPSLTNGVDEMSATAAQEKMPATRQDMRKLISGSSVPFSKYLIRAAEKSFIVVPDVPADKQNGLGIKEHKGSLQVILPFDLAKEAGLLTNTDTVPIVGGWAFGGKVAVLPGLYEPAPCFPSWVPAGVTMALGNSGKIEYSLAGTFRNETEKLVSFMEMQKALQGATADVIDYFTTVPQLKKLLDQMQMSERGNPDLSVLSTSGPNPFALVILRRN